MYERYETPVRCERGHLYTSIWVPGLSVKALRLNPSWRIQRCPVGHHWSRTERLDAIDLSPQQREAAAANHDSRFP